MTLPTDPRQIVTRGYDAAADDYARWLLTNVVDPARPRYLETFSTLLAPGSTVLELGCGGGGPTTQALAERFALTGIDISAAQIARAQRLLPQATFLQADMTRFEAPAASFDGIAAFYSLIHLPYGELPAMLVRIASWLRPGGALVASLNARAGGEHIEPAWLANAPMYWSGYPIDDSLEFLAATGLEVIEANVETAIEDGEASQSLWVIARKPAPPP